MQSILTSIDDNEVPDNPAILSPDAKRPLGRPKNIDLKIGVHHQGGR